MLYGEHSYGGIRLLFVMPAQSSGAVICAFGTSAGLSAHPTRTYAFVYNLDGCHSSMCVFILSLLFVMLMTFMSFFGRYIAASADKIYDTIILTVIRLILVLRAWITVQRENRQCIFNWHFDELVNVANSSNVNLIMQKYIPYVMFVTKSQRFTHRVRRNKKKNATLTGGQFSTIGKQK